MSTAKIMKTSIEMLDRLPMVGYRLTQPIPLSISVVDDSYWATTETLAGHGVGASPSEAVEDYAYGLVDYYEGLHERRDALAPHLLEQLCFLEALITKSGVTFL